jgi:hypothetical protein
MHVYARTCNYVHANRIVVKLFISHSSHNRLLPSNTLYLLVVGTIGATHSNHNTSPLTTCCQSIPTPIMDMPLFMTPIMKAPITAPMTFPTPPEADAPPMKTAAITSSSNPTPAFGVAVLRRAEKMSPASAANALRPSFTFLPKKLFT